MLPPGRSRHREGSFEPGQFPPYFPFPPWVEALVVVIVVIVASDTQTDNCLEQKILMKIAAAVLIQRARDHTRGAPRAEVRFVVMSSHVIQISAGSVSDGGPVHRWLQLNSDLVDSSARHPLHGRKGSRGPVSLDIIPVRGDTAVRVLRSVSPDINAPGAGSALTGICLSCRK